MKDKKYLGGMQKLAGVGALSVAGYLGGCSSNCNKSVPYYQRQGHECLEAPKTVRQEHHIYFHNQPRNSECKEKRIIEIRVRRRRDLEK